MARLVGQAAGAAALFNLASRVTLASLVGLATLPGCADNPEPQTANDVYDPCSPGPRLEHGGKTAGEAAKTGATTAWEGMKTFGKSVGGFVTEGTDEAEKEWEEGADETGKKGREGAAKTKATAQDDPCP
jgi:hypothetical protein